MGVEFNVLYSLLLWVLGLLGIGNMVGVRAAKSFHEIQAEEKAFKKKLF